MTQFVKLNSPDGTETTVPLESLETWKGLGFVEVTGEDYSPLAPPPPAWQEDFNAEAVASLTVNADHPHPVADATPEPAPTPPPRYQPAPKPAPEDPDA